jgi:DNA (cytosine-5)-methyltransferase 1
MSTDLRNQIRAIPTFPRGMNFSKAWNESNGVMTQEQRDLFPLYTREGKLRENTKHGSHAWGRVGPKGLFPTIVVALSAADSRVGCNLHWDDHRYLTTMEARRAQSFPDDEILLGSPAEGWKLMGNSVARSVALALGLSLREAWLKNDPDNETLPTKDNISSPVLKERRSGIEIVIHTSARRSKPKTKQVKASAKQQLIPVVDAELASKSLGKANRRTVAPNKARGSRFVPDLESPMGEESAPSISSINRPVVTNTGRSRREIPDSMEASADEDSLSKETFHRFPGSLELRTPSSRDELALSESGETSKSRQVKLTSRKRPHGMMQKSEEMAHERSRKVPRVIIPSTTSSSGPVSRPTNRQHPKAQSLNASTLVKKLDDVRRDQSRRRPEPLSNDDDDEDSDKEIAAAPSYSAQPSSLKSSVKSRANQTANSSSSKTPSKENAKDRVVISLVTEDEHEDEDEDLGTTAGLLGRAGVPSASKYVPVDNGNLLAYAQTNRFMNHGKNRKRVTVR